MFIHLFEQFRERRWRYDRLNIYPFKYDKDHCCKTSPVREEKLAKRKEYHVIQWYHEATHQSFAKNMGPVPHGRHSHTGCWGLNLAPLRQVPVGYTPVFNPSLFLSVCSARKNLSSINTPFWFQVKVIKHPDCSQGWAMVLVLKSFSSVWASSKSFDWKYLLDCYCDAECYDWKCGSCNKSTPQADFGVVWERKSKFRYTGAFQTKFGFKKGLEKTSYSLFWKTRVMLLKIVYQWKVQIFWACGINVGHCHMKCDFPLIGWYPLTVHKWMQPNEKKAKK